MTLSFGTKPVIAKPTVLMLSTDRNLLNLDSAVGKRHQEYGSLVEELHIVLFSLRSVHTSTSVRLSANVIVHPTASFSKWFYILDAYRLGRRIMRSGRITLISAQNPFETGIVAWLLARGGIRFDVQLHTDPFAAFFTRGHGFMNRLRVLMARFLLPRAHAVRVVSERIRKHINALWPLAQVTVLPIYVDIRHIEKSIITYDLHALYPQFSIIILVLSRLEPEKNITMGIDAFARVDSSHSGVGLVIIGKGSQKKALEKRAKNLGIGDKVIFHGWVEETASAFKTADIFLLMSDFEGYALTLIEAAASGAPTLTTDVGLVGDILRDEESVLVCQSRDVACMARNLARLVEDTALRARLAEGARRAVKERVLQNREEYIAAYGRIWA